MQEMTLMEVTNKLAIHELLARYAERIDANDPAGAAACFAPDGIGVYWGEYQGREAITKRLTTILKQFHATSHHLSNVQIKLTGVATASCMSYVYAFHRMKPDMAEMHYYGRWVDELVKQDGQWLFARREVKGVGSVGSTRGGKNADFNHPGHPGRL